MAWSRTYFRNANLTIAEDYDIPVVESTFANLGLQGASYSRTDAFAGCHCLALSSPTCYTSHVRADGDGGVVHFAGEGGSGEFGRR